VQLRRYLLRKARDVRWYSQNAIASSQQQDTGACPSQVSVNKVFVTAIKNEIHCFQHTALVRSAHHAVLATGCLRTAAVAAVDAPADTANAVAAVAAAAAACRRTYPCPSEFMIDFQ
jgi:hypothetical protein